MEKKVGLILRKPETRNCPPRYGPVKHTTLAVMLPVTRAPDDDTLPILWFVVTVAEISVSPHACPITVIKPVAASTVTICGVFEFHTT